ncbi:MAG: F-type H+-transporting ATPase subunit b [Pseudohongiellaceae bacterium]|jgi:F-type H+-transporting ATPase subunit b
MISFLAAGGFDPLAFDPSAYILTTVTFLVLLAILGKFTWKPMLEAIEVRENRIHEAITEAEDRRRHADELFASYQEKVANVEQEVADLREQGRTDAESIAREIRAQSDRDATDRVERAVKEIELARIQAIEDIRKEAVSLGMAVASKVVGRSLESEDQLRLANEVVAGLGGSGLSGI